MALVREFNSQIPIWFPHLHRRGNRHPLRLDVSRNLSSALALSPVKRKDPSHLGNGRSCAHPDVRGGAQPLSASDVNLLYESVTPTGP
jgi:hypothetical protein